MATKHFYADGMADLEPPHDTQHDDIMLLMSTRYDTLKKQLAKCTGIDKLEDFNRW